mmetsp:Transcript_19918/g.20235  ORF Transcript_19918/g.20235 Transcript_19918/m.20235 type:complete len:193 (-) Transcript_19918:145-723(-)
MLLRTITKTAQCLVCPWTNCHPTIGPGSYWGVSAMHLLRHFHYGTPNGLQLPLWEFGRGVNGCAIFMAKASIPSTASSKGASGTQWKLQLKGAGPILFCQGARCFGPPSMSSWRVRQCITLGSPPPVRYHWWSAVPTLRSVHGTVAMLEQNLMQQALSWGSPVQMPNSGRAKSIEVWFRGGDRSGYTEHAGL